MKMELAVYTAQEGYSWQPGTAFTADELMQFKKCMGKFPSPDSMDFPFGGIFRLRDLVVFYRYHVAKKIDFRGRDALYCILGAVTRDEAAKIDPAVLFALPQFAQPVKPFPTSVAVPETPSAPAWWLEKLNGDILNVRISGPADKPKYNFLTTPPGEEKKPQSPLSAPTGMRGASPSANVGTKVTEVGQSPAPQVRTEIVRELYYPQWMIWTIATLAVLVLALSVLVAAMWWQMKGGTTPPIAQPGDTNIVEKTSVPTSDVTTAVAPTTPPEEKSATKGPETKPQSGTTPGAESTAAPAKPEEKPDQHKTTEKPEQSKPAEKKPVPNKPTEKTTSSPAPAPTPKASSPKSAPKGNGKPADAKTAPKGTAKPGDAKKTGNGQPPPKPIVKGEIKNPTK